jgi:hypothetical protein
MNAGKLNPEKRKRVMNILVFWAKMGSKAPDAAGIYSLLSQRRYGGPSLIR